MGRKFILKLIIEIKKQSWEEFGRKMKARNPETVLQDNKILQIRKTHDDL